MKLKIIYPVLFLLVSVSNVSPVEEGKYDSIKLPTKLEVNHWYRGNTHAHARFSDKINENDVPEIAKWYRKSGYDFLLLSEHNHQLSKKKVICHDEAAKPPEFIMLCGLELTRSTHTTALGINRFIDHETSLQDAVNKTIAAGGISILNHPQEPPVSALTVIKTKGLNHFEVFNGDNPQDTPSCEQLWDSVLSAPGGRVIYAVASDDCHYKKSKVGRGWIMVNSASLTKQDIQEGIRTGNFYASTGIFLSKYSIDGNLIAIDCKNGSHITFIGKNGKILKKLKGKSGTYQITGNEYYIRIRITDESGRTAWTQPVFIKDIQSTN
jgi:hypothetical protein